MSVSFSYAQAAKGKAAAAASGSTSPSTAAASVTGAPDHQIKDVLLNGAPEPAAPAADARNDEPEPMRNSKAEAIPAASVSDASCTTNNDTPGTSGPPSNDSRRDDDTNSERSARRTANDTKSQAPGSRAPRPASTTADPKRPRKERKTKGAGNGPKNVDKESDVAETVKEAAPLPIKVELFDSPIPAKNPWQRLGTQTPTTKQGASEPASPNTAAPSARKSAAASSSSTVKPGSDAVAVNGLGIQRKGGEGDTSGKNGVHKNGARRAAEQLPSDTAHWPTPDTANKDQKPRPSDKTVEPQENPSQDGQKGSKTKGWVKMEFVPSVSFKTQIPPKGGRPRGGARGGRDGTTRGGHAASSAKDGEKGSGPPAGSSKVNGDAPEGARDAPVNARGSSVPPTTTKRGSADAPGVRDQRKQSVPAAAKSKDSATNEQQPRDKHEGRGDRPRGGARGRGGGYAPQFNAQHATFTTAPYTPSATSRQQNQYSPPIRQNQFNSYGSAPSRGGRGGRGGSNTARGSGPNNGNGRHAPSSMMPYDPSFHQPSMMGYPQAPSPVFLDPFIVSTLTAQIGWYFSIQNLCRDIFLRSNMDSQGFVPLSLIAGFNRVLGLLGPQHDVTQYVRQSSIASPEIEVVLGDDGIDRLRPANNPRHWVLPMEDRIDSAKNDGPASFVTAPHVPQQQYPQGGAPSGYPTAPPTMNSYPAAYGEPRVNSFSSPASPNRGPALVNGHSAGQDTEGLQTTGLKATVPEFSPRNATGDFPKAQVDETNGTTPLESQAEFASTADNAASS